MSLFRFLKSRYFWIHFGLSIVLTIVLLWFSLRILDLYTLHGKTIVVPDFKNIKMDQLEEFADDNNLRYEIIDSIYDFSREKGSVVMQDPVAGTKVKKNRKIYLTVVATKHEQVSVPNLLDLTLRQATAMLETYGLKVGKLQYVPDIAKNAVLKQKFNGQIIEEGTKVEKGSKIDLVLGQGTEHDKTEIPEIYGMKQIDAIRLLKANSLNVGTEVFEDGQDTSVSRVFKVSPSERTVVTFGTSVNLWYHSERKYKFKNLKTN
jgi:eukaryotic-like serine/threonine-protein kinase